MKTTDQNETDRAEHLIRGSKNIYEKVSLFKTDPILRLRDFLKIVIERAFNDSEGMFV